MNAKEVILNFIYNLKKGVMHNKPVLTTVRYWPHFFYYNFKNKSTMELEVPWLTLGAIDFLKDYIQKSHQIFEYGSGGSTLYFSSKAKEVVSVEHDKDWYETVKNTLSLKKIENVRLILAEGSIINRNEKFIYKSNYGVTFKNLNFFNYVHSIDQFQDHSFDIIIIDGRARGEALKASLSKLKENGIIVFDNADRESYQSYIHTYLKGFDRKIFFGPTICDLGFSETHIYFK